MKAIINIKNNQVDLDLPLNNLNTFAGATSSTFNSNHQADSNGI